MSLEIQKVYEPSHIRRGRLSTTPTWFVTDIYGSRWKFSRKLDAARFINAGGVCSSKTHEESPSHLWRCDLCLGWMVSP